MAVQKVGTNIIDPSYTTAITTNPVFSGTGSITVPSGTTAQRPGSPTVGMVRYNTTLGNLEQYTNLGWISIAAPPTISSVASATILASSDPQTITINGSNFDSNATVTILGANLSTTYTPATTSYLSSSQISCTFTSAGGLLTGAGSAAGGGEPYSVKVSNSTGLSTTLTSAFNINDVATWVTTAGSLGTVYDTTAISTITLSATDPEGGGLTYAVSTGALPGGLSLSSGGAITGTPSGGSYNSSGVTYNFTVTASDGAQTAGRSFSILKKWYDGSTSQLAATSAAAIYAISSSIPNGEYYINLPTVGVTQIYCDIAGGGWMVAANITTDGGNWKYEDTTWTGTGVLNASLTGNSTFDNSTDRKYNTYNYFSASQFRLWHSGQNTLYAVFALPSSNTMTWHLNNTSAEITPSYPNGTSYFKNNGTMCATYGINRSCSGTDVGTVAMRIGGMHKEGCYGFYGLGANSAASGANGVSNAQRNIVNGYVRGSTTSGDGGCTSSRRWDNGQLGNTVIWVK